MEEAHIEKNWINVVNLFSKNAKEGISIEGILLLIGIQESHILKDLYSKEEKIDLIHIGMCHILMNDGYYEFSHYDQEQWPHYKNIKPLPIIDIDEETIFIKEKIIGYCQKNGLL